MIESRNEDEIYVRCWQFLVLVFSSWYEKHSSGDKTWKVKSVKTLYGTRRSVIRGKNFYAHKIFCRPSESKRKKKKKGRWKGGTLRIKSLIIHWPVWRTSIFYSWMLFRQPPATQFTHQHHVKHLDETFLPDNWKLTATLSLCGEVFMNDKFLSFASATSGLWRYIKEYRWVNT